MESTLDVICKESAKRILQDFMATLSKIVTDNLKFKLTLKY